MDKLLGIFEDKKPNSQPESDSMFNIFKKKPEPIAKKPEPKPISKQPLP